MKIIDKTPFRGEDGSISLIDRIQATLKYGLPWYDRIQAQEKIIAVFEKQLGRNFILMRNVTLGGTDVELPLILIGPPGIFVINVITEKGVFRAKDDEWGTISGSQLVPAKVNQVVRTSRMGQVLKIFLERAGLKDKASVDSILLSTDPGTHIESVRPIVRVVMSDALERLVASLAQARDSLGPEISATIAQVILSGKPVRLAPETAPEAEPEPEPTRGFFQDEDPVEAGDGSLGEFTFEDTEEENPEEAQTAPPKKPARKGKQRIMGMTVTQLTILAGILLVWLCVVTVFLVIINAQLNA
jgi:hypothetical protein